MPTNDSGGGTGRGGAYGNGTILLLGLKNIFGKDLLSVTNLRFGNSVLLAEELADVQGVPYGFVIVELLTIGGNGRLGLKIILGRDVSVLNLRFGNSVLVAEVQGVPYGRVGTSNTIIVVVVDPSISCT